MLASLYVACKTFALSTSKGIVIPIQWQGMIQCQTQQQQATTCDNSVTIHKLSCIVPTSILGVTQRAWTLYFVMGLWFSCRRFFALFDCQQSSWHRNLSVVCRPSVVRPCVRPCWILVVASPVSYARTFLEFLKKNDFLRIFFVFVNIGPNGSENFKTLLLLQIAAKSFETCPEFSSQWSSQKYVRDFWNFEVLIFNDFFSKIANSPL